MNGKTAKLLRKVALVRARESGLKLLPYFKREWLRTPAKLRARLRRRLQLEIRSTPEAIAEARRARVAELLMPNMELTP